MSSDPKRLRDEGSPASRHLRQLLIGAALDLPSDAQLASLASKLGPVLAAPAGGAAAGSGLGTAAKLALAAAVLAGAGVATVAYLRGTHSVPPAHPSALAVSAPSPAPSPAPPSRAPGEAPLGSAELAPAVEGPSSTPEASASRPGGPVRPAETEAELLERARSALGTSPARALALTDQHRAHFPAGVLTQEREVIAIEALKRLGRTDAAARRASDFARRYPGSAYQKKLDASPR
jgi:hypothetical protein